MLEADRIDLELCVQNTGATAFAFTAALHGYLRCVQVEDVSIEGLYGHDYRDATRNNAVVRGQVALNVLCRSTRWIFPTAGFTT